MTPDTSGPTWRSPLAFYDLDEFCWRTSQGTFGSELPKSSLTLPAWGTWDDTGLYELPTPELPTAGSAGSASRRMLPTPVVNDMGEGKTPDDWDDWTGRMQAKHGNGNGHGPSLAVETLRLANPRPGSLLPSPRATDGEKGGPNQRGSKGDLMLPSAVQAFTGVPTPPPSAAGNASSDDQLPGQLSLDGTGSD